MGSYDYRVPKGNYRDVLNVDMRIGSKVVNTNGDEAVVIDIDYDKKHLYLEFLSHRNYCHLEPSVASSVLEGSFKDWYSPTVYGSGICGYPPEKDGQIYYNWKSLIHRVCYRPDERYKECTISPEFMCFQEYYHWYRSEETVRDYPYQLDKDLFAFGVSKHYSRDTCCLLPKEINAALAVRKEPKIIYNVFNKYHLGRNKTDVIEDREDYFDTPEECIHFYNSFKKQKLMHLVEKYRDVLKPYVIARLKDFKFEHDYRLK